MIKDNDLMQAADSIKAFYFIHPVFIYCIHRFLSDFVQPKLFSNFQEEKNLEINLSLILTELFFMCIYCLGYLA